MLGPDLLSVYSYINNIIKTQIFMLGPDLLSVYSYINNIIKNTNIHAVA